MFLLYLGVGVTKSSAAMLFSHCSFSGVVDKADFVSLFFAARRRLMEITRLRIEGKARTIFLAEGVQKWQQRAKEKRIPLVDLARKMHATVGELRSMLRKGPRKAAKKAMGVKTLLEETRKVFTPRKKRRCSCRRPTTAAIYEELDILSMTVRHAQRLTSPLKRVRQAGRWKQIKENRKGSIEERQISPSQLAALNSSSQGW